MANPIGFNDFINSGDFDSGTAKIVSYLTRITKEISSAKTAADGFASALGGNLKKDIAGLSSTSKTLSSDLQKITQRMTEFKTTTTQVDKVIGEYEKELERLNKELDKLQRNQKETSKSTQASGSSFKSATQSLIGLAGGAALVYSGISELKNQIKLAIKSTMDFEQAMKEVQAISRASADELKLLTENANRLGATTEKTAGDIARLQKELGKLGFNTTEILASTDAIVDLSTATGEDLANSATIAAATLRAFGLEATEMNRVVDVMAGSFVRSGLDLDKFKESMKLVAPIARATGVDIEATTASLSKLADAGLSGSLAGTSLRNLLSSMADPSEKLTKFMGQLNGELADGVKSSDDLILAFKELKASGIGLADAVQMVDVRARPAFFTLMNQADAVEGLYLQYKILDGEATKIADTMRDTLANDIKIADSAFDAMRRNLTENFIPALRTTAQSAASFSEFMRFIIKDVSEWEKETSALSTALSTLGDVLVVGFLWKKMFGEIEKFNSFNKAEEDIESVTISIGTLTEDLKKVPTVFKAISESQKMLDDGTFENASKAIEDIATTLGGEYDILLKKFKAGVLTEEEAVKTLKSMAQTSLFSIDSSIKQQEDKLVLLQREYELEVDKNGQAEAGTKAFDRQNALLQNIKSINTFLKGSYDEQAKINAYMNKLKEDALDYNEVDIEDAKEKKKVLSEQLKLEQQIREEKQKGVIDNLSGSGLGSSPQATLGLDKKVTEEKIKLAKIRYENELQTIEELYKEDKTYLLRRELAYEQYINEIDKLSNEFLGKIGKFEEDSIKTTTKVVEDIMKKSGENLKKMAEDRMQEIKDDKQEEIDAEEEKWDKIKDITQQAAQGLSEITRFVFDNRALARQNEMDAVEAWEAHRIEMAGDNAEAITAIEKEAEEKRKQIRIKQAKDDKKEALFQIAIQTAVNIVKAVGNPLKMILAGAIGVAQAAIVASRPLPQFEKGTLNSPEGKAIVGEKGRELIVDGKTGKARLSKNYASLEYLTKGSKVIPTDQTERILNSVDHNSMAENYLNRSKQVSAPQGIDYGKMGDIFKEAVTEIPVNITNFDGKGVSNYVKKRNVKIQRLNKRY